MPPTTRAPVAPGLLLIRADLEAARTWARRGLVAVRLQPLGGWTAVTLAEATAKTSAPYDDGLSALAARPVGPRMRPSIGFFVADDVATITARSQGWRNLQRWTMWTRDAGLHHPEQFPPLRPGDLADISGGVVGASAVEQALHARANDPLSWLTVVHGVLRLPGAELIAGGPMAGGEIIEPTARTVAGFDALVAEEQAHTRDLGGDA